MFFVRVTAKANGSQSLGYVFFFGNVCISIDIRASDR